MQIIIRAFFPKNVVVSRQKSTCFWINIVSNMLSLFATGCLYPYLVQRGQQLQCYKLQILLWYSPAQKVTNHVLRIYVWGHMLLKSAFLINLTKKCYFIILYYHTMLFSIKKIECWINNIILKFLTISFGTLVVPITALGIWCYYVRAKTSFSQKLFFQHWFNKMTLLGMFSCNTIFVCTIITFYI